MASILSMILGLILNFMKGLKNLKTIIQAGIYFLKTWRVNMTPTKNDSESVFIIVIQLASGGFRSVMRRDISKESAKSALTMNPGDTVYSMVETSIKTIIELLDIKTMQLVVKEDPPLKQIDSLEAMAAMLRDNGYTVTQNTL